MGTKECGRAGTVDAADTAATVSTAPAGTAAPVSTAATVNTDSGSDAATTAARLVGAATGPLAGPALTGEC